MNKYGEKPGFVDYGKLGLVKLREIPATYK